MNYLTPLNKVASFVPGFHPPTIGNWTGLWVPLSSRSLISNANSSGLGCFGNHLAQTPEAHLLRQTDDTNSGFSPLHMTRGYGIFNAVRNRIHFPGCEIDLFRLLWIEATLPLPFSS